MSLGFTKAQKDEAKRAAALADHIRSSTPGPFDAASLSRSYALSAAQVSAIITKHGGRLG